QDDPGTSHCSGPLTTPSPHTSHDPCVVGFDTENWASPLLATAPSANCMLYESPPTSWRSAHAEVPLFGGDTVIAPPPTAALIVNTPPLESLICATLTGPFSCFGSLYLRPFAMVPVQNGLPVIGLRPPFRVNVCVPGVVPSTRTTRNAP